MVVVAGSVFVGAGDLLLVEAVRMLARSDCHEVFSLNVSLNLSELDVYRKLCGTSMLAWMKASRNAGARGLWAATRLRRTSDDGLQ